MSMSYLVVLSGELKVGSLHDGVDRARLLAETAVDALGHVNVVSRGSPGPVAPLLSLNCDCLGGTDGLTELAGNAPLLPAGVPSQSVLSAEPWGQGPLLEGIVDGGGLLEDVPKGDCHPPAQLSDEQSVCGIVCHLPPCWLALCGVDIDILSSRLVTGRHQREGRAPGQMLESIDLCQ